MTFKRFATVLTLSIATFGVMHEPATAETCDLPWDIPCCAMEGEQFGTAIANLVICNCTDVESTYDFQMKTTQPGVTFSPGGGVVTLAPGDCIEIPITIHCPTDGGVPGMNGFIFSACVTNATTGATFSCDGSVRDVTEYKVIPSTPIIDIFPVEPGLPVGPPATARLVVSNIGSSGKDGVSIDVAPMGGVEVIPQWTNPVFPPPGGAIVLEAEVRSLRDHEPFVFYDIILMYDGDGDGTQDEAGSFRARSVPAKCIGDLDGDGTVGSSDLAQLIGRWGPCP